MKTTIGQSLTKLFEKHRILFWYDTKEELRKEFEALKLPGVNKVDVNNNEFGLKFRMLREQSDQKFLLYHEGPRPDDLNHWLLDVELSQGQFYVDQASLWLIELGLGLEFAKVVEPHVDFLNHAKRRDSLKKLLKPDDTPSMLRLKMLAVCAGAEPRIDDILENLLAESAERRDDKMQLVQRCGLEGFLWEQVKRCYGYDSDSPGLHDFAIQLFKDCYYMALDPNYQTAVDNQYARLNNDAMVFLRRWKDSRQHEACFETLSHECADVLAIQQDLGQRDYQHLLELDLFRLIDQKILSDLTKAVAERTLSAGDCAIQVRQRRRGHWYGDFKHTYEAVDFAAQFIYTMTEVDLSIESLDAGIQRYSQTWFRLDQFYRKFIFHVQKSGQVSLLEKLIDQVENQYNNKFLLKLNDQWQGVVDKVKTWDMFDPPAQKAFFKKTVETPFLKKGKKVFVVISDALRYEIGEELVSLIRREDRYGATITPSLGMLPSYTQLGMAALLPHKTLTLAPDGSGGVLADGKSTQGTSNRNKLLVNAVAGKGIAIRAEDVLVRNTKDCRDLFRDHKVVYVYHNRIDATGDKRDSEGQVFGAVEETLGELVLIIKKLTAANANNLIVTSDHGFIYQNRPIDESDFSNADVSGDQILFKDRRFVIGKGLKDDPGLRRFSSAELGLDGDLEVQIPKSINRLRLKGAGSRYVHGGASLQEVVVPVIHINKKRENDVTAVDVEILRGATSVITSGQLGVVFYQTGPVSDKVQARYLKAGIYTEAGDLISDSHDLAFDLTAESPRQREQQVRFVLSHQADKANDQEVILRLEEPVPGTSHFKEYTTLRYRMRRSFTSDFDF